MRLLNLQTKLLKMSYNVARQLAAVCQQVVHAVIALKVDTLAIYRSIYKYAIKQA
jgi:hypothetical protein